MSFLTPVLSFQGSFFHYSLPDPNLSFDRLPCIRSLDFDQVKSPFFPFWPDFPTIRLLSSFPFFKAFNLLLSGRRVSSSLPYRPLLFSLLPDSASGTDLVFPLFSFSAQFFWAIGQLYRLTVVPDLPLEQVFRLGFQTVETSVVLDNRPSPFLCISCPPSITSCAVPC